jgi:electron transfer flavoprotein alpha subunit
MSGIYIIEDSCNGCKKCLKVCDQGAIELINKKARINLEKCNLCGLCINSCKFDAIVITKTSIKKSLKEYKDVWVFLENFDNELNPKCLQVLSKGFELAKILKEKLTAVIVAKKIVNEAKIKKVLSEYGVSNIKILECKQLDYPYAEDIAKILSDEVRNSKPSIFLFLGTNFGRELAPRISANINTGLTADCTDLQIDSNKNLVQIRPTYGGKILASIICPNNRPQMASIRPNIFEDKKVRGLDFIPTLNIKDVDIDYSIGNLKKLIKSIKYKDQDRSLEDADIIVCGGFGLGSKDNFKLLEEFAEKIGGVVAGSREAVDRGWIDFSHQVGQTGKIVRPMLYIGCGVSGAIHHLIGMRNSKKIIAINKDKKAPILKIADVAIIGDLFKIIPAIMENI